MYTVLQPTRQVSVRLYHRKYASLLSKPYPNRHRHTRIEFILRRSAVISGRLRNLGCYSVLRHGLLAMGDVYPRSRLAVS
jgi:hypothetical protein